MFKEKSGGADAPAALSVYRAARRGLREPAQRTWKQGAEMKVEKRRNEIAKNAEIKSQKIAKIKLQKGLSESKIYGKIAIC